MFDAFRFGQQTGEDVFLGEKIQDALPGAWVPAVMNGGIGMFTRAVSAYCGGRPSTIIRQGHDSLTNSVSGGGYSEALLALADKLEAIGL